MRGLTSQSSAGFLLLNQQTPGIISRSKLQGDVMASCHHCGSQFPEGMAVFRTSECPSYAYYIRVCRNCTHFAPGSHWDCRETVSDQVTDKERANFCDWFKLSTVSGDRSDAQKKVEQARRGFSSLFGDTEAS